MDIEEKRQANREAYPEVAEWVDAVRRHWPGAKVVYFGPKRRSREPIADDPDGTT